MTGEPRPSAYTPLLLVLLIFTVLGGYYSLILPLGEAPDETVHFDMIAFVAQNRHPPLTVTERAEAGLRGGFAPLYYMLAALSVASIDLTSPPQLRRLDQQPERHIPADGLSTQQILHTQDESIPGKGVILAWRVARWLSIPLGWLTIILTYAIARLVVPRHRTIALGAAIFAAFLPRFIINSSVINEDNLAIPLAATVLWFLIKIINGDTRTRLFVGLGVALALAVLTKYYNLVLLPEVVAFLAFAAWRGGWSKKEITYRWGLTLLALVIVAGPWFGFILWQFGHIAGQGWPLGVATALGEPQIIGGLQKLQGGVIHQVIAPTFGFGEWFFGLLFRSFWAEFGWMTIFAPTALYWLLGGLTVCAIIGVLYAFVSNRTTLRDTTRLLCWLLLATHTALFFGVVSLRYSLGQTIDTGQGRHLFPTLPAIAIFFVVGLSAFIQLVTRKKSDSRTLVWLSVSLATLLLTIGITFSLISVLPVYYPYLSVTTNPEALVPARLQHPLDIDNNFVLVDLYSPATVAAGDALPVTLTWQVTNEVNQDYLVSLCLRDEQNRAAGCWRGHFANGRYPSRAWEAGDILTDTIYVPIPVCYRLGDQPYHLELELWPLIPDSPKPTVANRPSFTHTFTQTAVTVRPTDSIKTLPQSAEIWLGNQRLTEPATLGLYQTLTRIAYAQQVNNFGSIFTHTRQNQTWAPLPQFNTSLYLPCDDGPSPFAQSTHFLVDPTLPAGKYQTETDSTPPVTLTLRNRNLAPLTTTLTFSHTLAPLSIQFPDQSSIDIDSHLPAPLIHTPGSILPITITWQSHRWMADPLVISLKLLDKDFNIGGEYVAGLGDRYPNVLWVPTEIVKETYPVRLNPNAPPGLYQLELSLIHQDKNLPGGYQYLPILNGDAESGTNLYPATIRLLDSAHGTPPPNPFSAQLGDSIYLTGYDLTLLPATAQLTLYWQNNNPVPTDYTVFTQLIGPDGQVWAQWDNPPQAGRYPTTAWAKYDTVVDRYTLTLREGAPAGEYRLLVGMYDPTTGERLPAVINGEAQPNNAIQLAVLSLNP
jgi:4-amino-4-deoxy-L-arabinose transferase-like glycosyltransferase